jgi:hypothetical protein
VKDFEEMTDEELKEEWEKTKGASRASGEALCVPGAPAE